MLRSRCREPCLGFTVELCLHRREGDDELEAAVEAIGRSIQHLVGTIKQHSCSTHVLILGVLPRGDLDGDRDYRDFKDGIEHLNDFLDDWVEDVDGVSFVDCNSDLLDSRRVERDYFESDYIELNREGFEELAKCLEPELEELLPDDLPSLRMNLIASDTQSADLLSPELAALFSPDELASDCRPDGDRTCYRATVVPIDPQTAEADRCEDWLELRLPSGSLDGRDDERDWDSANSKIREVVDDIDSEGEVGSALCSHAKFCRLSAVFPAVPTHTYVACCNTGLPQGVRLLFLGDDGVAAWNSDGVRPVFENFFAEPFGALALGIEGDTSLNVLQRLQDDDFGDLVPEVTVLQAGLNDLVRYFPASALQDEDSLRLVADRIVNATVASVAEVNPTPARSCAANPRVTVTHHRNFCCGSIGIGRKESQAL